MYYIAICSCVSSDIIVAKVLDKLVCGVRSWTSNLTNAGSIPGAFD